jgi:hypothetical protein
MLKGPVHALHPTSPPTPPSVSSISSTTSKVVAKNCVNAAMEIEASCTHGTVGTYFAIQLLSAMFNDSVSSGEPPVLQIHSLMEKAYIYIHKSNKN